MSQNHASAAGTSQAPPADPPASTNPLKRLAQSNDGHLYFMTAGGATLLVIGLTGRLLKRAKASALAEAATPTPPIPTPSYKPPPPTLPLLSPKAASSPKPAPIPTLASKPRAYPSTPSLPPPPSRLRPRPLLKTWVLSSPTRSDEYFLPNSTILTTAKEQAEEIDKEETKFLDDGVHEVEPDKEAEASTTHEESDGKVKLDEDGALWIGKAFAIATAGTLTLFGVGIATFVNYFGVPKLPKIEEDEERKEEEQLESMVNTGIVAAEIEEQKKR
ncbi:hypothetical protein MNV49_000127 [Pseudohyphozyma bogoriensis]|nr:hypothetical protein MNV49_000127 [Pseudohyphozyma bogoriensis]